MRASQPALVGTGGLPTARQWAGWLSDPDTVARFTAKVYRRAGDACWPWCGALDADGHGSYRAGSRRSGTSWVIAAHVFAYQLAHGLCAARLLASDVVIRHRCDEACCQNPAHLALGTATMNVAEYRTRRHRVGGPLGDTRGAAGRARAIRAAVLAARAEGPDAVEAALAAALTAGDRYAHQPPLFGPPGPGTVRLWGAASLRGAAAPVGNADSRP